MDQGRVTTMRMRRRRNQASAGASSFSGPSDSGTGDGSDGSATELATNVISTPVRFFSAPGSAFTSSILNQSVLAAENNGNGLADGDDLFTVNPSNGTMSLAIKLPTSESANLFQPNLSLIHSSGWGNGPFGLGWQAGLPSITRNTKIQIPSYNGGEDSYMLAGQSLVRLEEAKKSENDYVIEKYGLPGPMEKEIRVERWTSNKIIGEVFWKTVTSNRTSFYGRNNSSRNYESCGGTINVFSWLLCESYDAEGNAAAYQYKSENDDGLDSLPAVQRSIELNKLADTDARARYIKSVMYGNTESCLDAKTSAIKPTTGNTAWSFSVVFDYGEHNADKPTAGEESHWKVRKDCFSSGWCGFETRIRRLCRRVLMFQHFPSQQGKSDLLLESTALTYKEEPAASLLEKVVHSKHTFDASKGYSSSNLTQFKLGHNALATLEELQVLDTSPSNLQNIDLSDSDAMTQWVDLDGEGSPGLLVQIQGTWLYQRNENALAASGLEGEEKPWRPDFGPVRELPSVPAVGGYTQMGFQDVDGTGHQDIIVFDNDGHITGLHERLVATDGWSDLQPIDSVPAASLFASAVQLDLTGNGRSDILFPGEKPGDLYWHPSLGRRGFDMRRSCQVVQDNDSDAATLSGNTFTSVFIADMTGDGLQDIVYISSGRVAYLANLGHGRFARQSEMLNAPILCDNNGDFAPERLQLVDVNGNGTTDIIYLPPSGGATIYFNECGNSFSTGTHLPQFPDMNHMSSVFALDLLGKGTNCLCWVGPEGTSADRLVLRYIDFAPRGKPNLLVSYSDEKGGETSISYVPSTAFSQHDEQQGKKWRTPVPFSTPLVRQVVKRDVKQNSVHESTYAYHDGFYDGTKREFCGFGTVDVWKTEQPTSATNGTVEHTKLWYHTGAPGGDSVLEATFRGQLIRSEKVDVEP